MAWPQDAVQGGPGAEQARGMLAGFRGEVYRCLGRRRDALVELADAVLCKRDRVHMLAELSLEPECRRGHGAVYDAVNAGQVRIARLRRALAALPLPHWDDGRIRLAADVSNWLRPDAATSPDRLFCHCYARGKGNAQLIPGWPYSVVAALEPGRTSWTLPLDAVRLGPADDATEVTAGQLRQVVERIIAAGHWCDGDQDILVVFDAGYDLTRLAWLLRDLPVEVLGRLRSDRVMYFPAPPRQPGTNGRPLRHGPAFKLADPGTWPAPAAAACTQTSRYGTARAAAWGRLHQQLAARAGWEDHDGELPIIGGTLILLHVDRLPGDRSPEPLWLWSSRAGTSADQVNRAWQAFLRRFDLEHTFRFFKQILGWTRPRLRDPAAADRWTWLIIACYAQLYLARHLAADIRLPWQRPCPPGRLTPARVRRGFRNIRQALPDLAGVPKPGKPGPGRPPGSKNRRPATRHDVGKTVKRDQPSKKTRSQKGLNNKLKDRGKTREATGVARVFALGRRSGQSEGARYVAIRRVGGRAGTRRGVSLRRAGVEGLPHPPLALSGAWPFGEGCEGPAMSAATMMVPSTRCTEWQSSGRAPTTRSWPRSPRIWGPWPRIRGEIMAMRRWAAPAVRTEAITDGPPSMITERMPSLVSCRSTALTSRPPGPGGMSRTAIWRAVSSSRLCRR
jgi:hypothetical protein